MERKEIITEFLKSGYSLDNTSLEFFSKNHEKIQEFLQKSQSIDKPPIITIDFVNDVLDGSTEAGEKIIKNFFIKPEKKKHTIDSAFELVADQYEKYRVAISDKLTNPMSINRAKSQNEFSLIVAVREKSGSSSAVVEDPTGNLNVEFENAGNFGELIDGDVVGIVCEKKSGGVYVKRIVFPGIDLKRDVNVAAEDVEYKITPGTVDGNKLIEISGVKVMICEWKSIEKYKDVWGSTENIVVNLLKRRNLSPGRNVGEESFWADNTFLDVVPDVFVTDNDKDVMTANYKGVTIVSAGHWRIDLRTREINKVDSV